MGMNCRQSLTGGFAPATGRDEMNCKNEVSYMVEKGNTMQYREIFIRCGSTGPDGESAICDKCESDPKIMQSIRNHQANVDADNAWNQSAGWGEM
jgi:hypothetical protein